MLNNKCENIKNDSLFEIYMILLESEFISSSKIAKILNNLHTNVSICMQIKELKKLGLVIISNNKFGYKYESPNFSTHEILKIKEKLSCELYIKLIDILFRKEISYGMSKMQK